MKRADTATAGIVVALFVGVSAMLMATGETPMSWDGIGTLVAAGLTLCIFSFLYKDNPFFRAAENLFVGLGLGITVYITWFNFFKPEIYDHFIRPAVTAERIYPSDLWLLIPCALGLMMLTRISSKYNWVSRWPVAFLVGYWSGFGLQPMISSYILKQAYATMQPVRMSVALWVACGVAALLLMACAYLSTRRDAVGLAAKTTGILAIVGYIAAKGYGSFADATQGVDTLLLMLGVISVLVYFFFSAEHKGVLGGVSKVGIWFLMVSFGASFGYTVMARESLLIGRIQFMLFEWLKLPKP